MSYQDIQDDFYAQMSEVNSKKYTPLPKGDPVFGFICCCIWIMFLIIIGFSLLSGLYELIFG